MIESLDGNIPDQPAGYFHVDDAGDMYVVGANRGKLRPIPTGLSLALTSGGDVVFDPLPTAEVIDRTVAIFQRIATPRTQQGGVE